MPTDRTTDDPSPPDKPGPGEQIARAEARAVDPYLAIVQLKTTAGLTWAQLAERASMTENGLRKIREGVARPRATTVRRIAIAAGASPADLLVAFGYDPSDEDLVREVLPAPRSTISHPVSVNPAPVWHPIAVDPAVLSALSADTLAGIARQLAGYADLLIQTELNRHERETHAQGTTAR